LEPEDRDFSSLISGPEIEELPPITDVPEYGFSSAQRVRLNTRTYGMRWFKAVGTPATGEGTTP